MDDGGAGVPAGNGRGAHEASKLGAAARSDRAEAALRVASPLAASSIGVDEPPLALVELESFVESAPLPDAAAQSPSLAEQVAAAAGLRVVERFEVMA